MYKLELTCKDLVYTEASEDVPEDIASLAQSCLTFCSPVACSLPDSSVHGIFQARILEWVAISFFKRQRECDNLKKALLF